MRRHDDLMEERGPAPEKLISATATEIMRHWQQSAPVFHEEESVKKNLVHKILNQIEYQAARQRGLVTMEPAEIAGELERLPVRALSAWYEALLALCIELMHAGEPAQGIRILDRPASALRKLMQCDPDFDARQYIF